MSISPVTNLYQSVLQSVGSSLKSSTTNGGIASTFGTSSTLTQDTNQLSPAAQMLQMLQQLQQQDPTKFKQLTADIASHLTADAAQATSSGNTSQATTLTNLASVFQTASQTGVAPSAQDLQQAGATTNAASGAQGHHHHHHHGGGSESSSSSNQTNTLMSLLSPSSDGSTLDSVASMFASMMDQSASGN